MPTVWYGCRSLTKFIINNDENIPEIAPINLSAVDSVDVIPNAVVEMVDEIADVTPA